MTTTAVEPDLARLEHHRRAMYVQGALTGATGRRIDILPSGLTQDAGLVLRAMVECEKAKHTIEIGMAVGMSTLFILEGLLAANPGETPQHTAVDPGQTKWWDNAAVLQLRQGGCEDCVELIQEDSMTALPRMIGERRRFDWAFIDGSHFFENVLIDIVCLSRLVKPGGLIVLDDLWMPAVYQAAAYAVTNLGLTPEPPAQPSVRRRLLPLRRPLTDPIRAWDHFVPFTDWRNP